MWLDLYAYEPGQEGYASAGLVPSILFLGFGFAFPAPTRAVPLLDPDSESGTMFPGRGTHHRTAFPATMIHSNAPFKHAINLATTY